MIKKKVFIDGKIGTVALHLEERISNRDDVEILSLPKDLIKDMDARKEILNEADFAFLCLPDSAAKGAVAMIDNLDTVVIDTSSAHRSNTAWAYGFPELSAEFDEKIKKSRRISLPGSQASGFNALIYPLIMAGLLSKDTPLIAHSVTGYSEGGIDSICAYEAGNRSVLLSAPRQYGLAQNSGFLRESVKLMELSHDPILCPYVADYYSGMTLTIPLFKSQLIRGGIDHIKAVYRTVYNTPLVYFNENPTEEFFVSAKALSTKDSMQIEVHGNSDKILLVAKYDNLGKGSVGAAIECLNIKMGCAYTKSLDI